MRGGQRKEDRRGSVAEEKTISANELNTARIP